MRKLRYLLPLVLAATLLGCAASPPDNLANSADALPGQIKAEQANVDKAKKTFEQMLNEGKYSFLKDYTPEQRHADRFDQAKKTLSAADQIFKNKVTPIVDNYEEAKKPALEAGIAEVNKALGEARTLRDDPAKWADRVVEVKAEPQKAVRTGATEMLAIKAIHDPLNKDVDAAKVAYPLNAAVIGKKFEPISSTHAKALTANANLELEAKKPSPNYALMATYLTTVQDGATSVKKDGPEFKAKLNRLGNTETHTLLDIRVDSVVYITRTTWDDASDFADEHTHEYISPVLDLEAANYFATFKADTLMAVDGSGGFKTEKGIDRTQWNKLSISSHTPKWSKGDTNAEFSFDEVEDLYCHKIRVLKNGKPDSSGRPEAAKNPCDNYNNQADTKADLADGVYWVESDELDADAMGMDIYGKGLGDFEDQATTEATPPGLIYVGNPAMGAWQTDSSGHSFWAFYGQYMFFNQLIGGTTPGYYSSDWDDWHRNYRYGSKPYYGKVIGGVPQFGMKSPMFASRFPNSYYTKSGLYASSVRGAGPAARGGGPGGGGK